MLSIMCDVMVEVDEVPESLLQVVLDRVMPGADREHPEAHQLAKHLLLRTAVQIEPALSALFTRLLDKARFTPVKSAAINAPFELLFGVFCVAPDLLLHVLPQLEVLITTDNVALRKAVVEALCRLVGHPSSKLHVQSPGLCVNSHPSASYLVLF